MNNHIQGIGVKIKFQSHQSQNQLHQRMDTLKPKQQ